MERVNKQPNTTYGSDIPRVEVKNIILGSENYHIHSTSREMNI